MFHNYKHVWFLGGFDALLFFFGFFRTFFFGMTPFSCLGNFLLFLNFLFPSIDNRTKNRKNLSNSKEIFLYMTLS